MTWDEVAVRKKAADDIQIDFICQDDCEQDIINEADEKIRAHREEKFKAALAEYMAQEGIGGCEPF